MYARPTLLPEAALLPEATSPPGDLPSWAFQLPLYRWTCTNRRVTTSMSDSILSFETRHVSDLWASRTKTCSSHISSQKECAIGRQKQSTSCCPGSEELSAANSSVHWSK